MKLPEGNALTSTLVREEDVIGVINSNPDKYASFDEIASKFALDEPSTLIEITRVLNRLVEKGVVIQRRDSDRGRMQNHYRLNSHKSNHDDL
jgi:predicted transcriptional regulator